MLPRRPWCAYGDRLERRRAAVDRVGQSARHHDNGGSEDDRTQHRDERELDRVEAAVVLQQRRDEGPKLQIPHGSSLPISPNEAGPSRDVTASGNVLSPGKRRTPPVWVRAGNTPTLAQRYSVKYS